MGDQTGWRESLMRPQVVLVVGLAGIGGVVVTVLLLSFLPNLPAMEQVGLIVIAALCYLTLAGTVLGFVRAQTERLQRQVAEKELADARRQHEHKQEQTKKLLSLQEQTLLYAQDLSDAVQRERLRVDELDSLQRVSMAVLSELSLESVLDLISEAAATLTQADTASVSLLTDDERMRTHVAAYGLAADALRGTSSPADTALHGWVIKSGDPLLVDNLHDTEWRRGRASIRRDGKQTAIVAPLKVKGHVIGCLSAFDKKLGKPFDEHDLQILSLFANQVAIAIENARLYKQIQDDLEGKSDLIQGIQSRVRESLSLVRDLFSAELGDEQPQGIRDYLQSGVRRVQIIAQVHDLLAQHDFGPLGFGELAESIAGLLQADLDTDDGQRIDLEIDQEGPLLSPRQVIPLALIASELVSEAVARQATGRIGLHARVDEDQVTVEVRGHGVGAMTNESSQRIIETLAENRLQGQVQTTTNDDNSATVIRFPWETRPVEPEPLPGVPLDAEMQPPTFLTRY